MFCERDSDVREHAAGDGAGSPEGGAAQEHEPDSRNEHHEVHLRGHRRGCAEAAGDHAADQVELLVDHAGLGVLLSLPLLFGAALWEQEQEEVVSQGTNLLLLPQSHQDLNCGYISRIFSQLLIHKVKKKFSPQSQF